jgi:outer membrane protein OmpA-like peptidoglycan-associated protein
MEADMLKPNSGRWFVSGRLAAVGALVAGCGGTIVFHGQKPIGVEGTPPAVAAAPAEAASRVKVGNGKLELTEKIQFADGKATILEASSGLMNEIASALKANPQIKKVMIEGHASSEGNAGVNLKLSGERASSVMAWLVAHDIAKARLSAKGFGSTRPIADNKTEEGREKNRRVDFVIVDPSPK